MKLLISSVLLASYVSADWQPFFWGTGCPEVTGSSNFELDSYLGTWYNIANSPFFWMSNKNRCVTAEYSMNDDDTIKVVNGDISRYTDKSRVWKGGGTRTRTRVPAIPAGIYFRLNSTVFSLFWIKLIKKVPKQYNNQ